MKIIRYIIVSIIIITSILEKNIFSIDHLLPKDPMVQAIILAAGKSSRFIAPHSKLRAKLCGKEIIRYATDIFAELTIPMICVVGHQKDEIKNLLNQYYDSISFIEQETPRGTGHAVACTQPAWQAKTILIINGDMPLITSDVITKILETHNASQAALTFAVTHAPEGGNYGRIFYENGLLKIVEARDCTPTMLQNTCINAGIYCIERDALETYIPQLQTHAGGEYYITDLIELMGSSDLTLKTVEIPYDCVRGVNTLTELAQAEVLKRNEIISSWVTKGVRCIMPETIYIEDSVTIGRNTTIYPGALVMGCTKIGSNCIIEGYCHIKDSIVHDNTTIKSHSVMYDSTIGSSVNVGPFAHVRNNTVVHNNAVIGNFVEVNNSIIGPESKAKHLAYLGNAHVGANVNIGAGTITCNYNGFTKEKTIIEDRAFIGSNSSLIAPLIVGKDAIVAAGSTITQDVPENSLALGRAQQVNKDGYATVIRAKYRSHKNKQNAQEL